MEQGHQVGVAAQGKGVSRRGAIAADQENLDDAFLSPGSW